MKTKLISAAILISIYLLSCAKTDYSVELDDSLAAAIKKYSHTGSTDWYIMPNSTDYDLLPNQDVKNPVTAEKVALGKLLFFETGIALEAKNPVSLQTYSCSSCHIPEKDFTAGRFQGIADGGIGFGNLGNGREKNSLYPGSLVDAQGARPLPVINLTYVRNALWNGAFGSYGLNIGTESAWGITDTLTIINQKGFEGLEANNTRALFTHRQTINKDILDKLGYTEMFDAAFPEIPVSQRYVPQMAANAIAAYFRTILTNKAPFQLWLKGNKEALTVQQKRGALLFYGNAGCINCHNSPSFNNQKFAAVGVKNLYQCGFEVFRTDENDARNKGRGGFTLRDEDLYKFKVPQLYNLRDIGFYFHGASKTSIKQVVEYFNNAVPENPLVPVERLDPFFKPKGLTSSEIDDLVAFVEDALYDPDLLRYKPVSVKSGNCFPNNDPQSKVDMGCK